MTEKIMLAGCVILDNISRILVIHRKDRHWEMPGGKVEQYETPNQTAIRELKEELNVMVNIEKDLGKKAFNDGSYEMEYAWFLATIVFGEPQIMEKGHDNFAYFSFEELKERNDLSSNLKNFVDAYFSGEILIDFKS
ncbi:MAG: NUDIX hydrolase [Candidatus Aenigmarchaeota archaeon]|nr:NUDIX hydrolase [Candidatus Aenigmarchaeota archaeon]